jgi:hypothetical protein
VNKIASDDVPELFDCLYNAAGWLATLVIKDHAYPRGFNGFRRWPESMAADARYLLQKFIVSLSLRKPTPQVVRAKFERGQKLHLLAWIDFDLIKAGELVALTTLELALKDRCGDKVRDKRGHVQFARLLEYMPRHDGLTDQLVPMVRRCGGSVVGLLTGACKPGLAGIRNHLAHGYPFDGFPYAGLLELVRDLIEYTYRDWG